MLHSTDINTYCASTSIYFNLITLRIAVDEKGDRLCYTESVLAIMYLRFATTRRTIPQGSINFDTVPFKVGQ